MTTDKNELIRYPVAVREAGRNHPWLAVVDSCGNTLLECISTNKHDIARAAEIVRVLNAYHAQSSHPAPVAASGEPSGPEKAAATELRNLILDMEADTIGVACGAKIIAKHFAAERAKSAEMLKMSDDSWKHYEGLWRGAHNGILELKEKLTAVERERDEARASTRTVGT